MAQVQSDMALLQSSHAAATQSLSVLQSSTGRLPSGATAKQADSELSFLRRKLSQLDQDLASSVPASPALSARSGGASLSAMLLQSRRSEPEKQELLNNKKFVQKLVTEAEEWMATTSTDAQSSLSANAQIQLQQAQSEVQSLRHQLESVQHTFGLASAPGGADALAKELVVAQQEKVSLTQQFNEHMAATMQQVRSCIATLSVSAPCVLHPCVYDSPNLVFFLPPDMYIFSRIVCIRSNRNSMLKCKSSTQICNCKCKPIFRPTCKRS